MFCRKLEITLKPKETHIVPEGITSIRLSDYTVGIFEIIPTRKGMKKVIDKGFVYVNGEQSETGRFIYSGDKIELLLPEDYKKAYELSVEVLFEDEHLAIVVKPSGLLSNGNEFKTLENCLPFNLQKSTLEDALFYPQVTHRLDYPTSGIVIIAKTRKANVLLKDQFAKREIQKTYHALTLGKMSKFKGVINLPIDSKEAISRFEVIQSKPSNKHEFINLVKLQPLTGRRHQLRIHLAHIGFPILGDREYGLENHWTMKRGLYLAATAISFQHPITNEQLSFETDLPKKFYKLLK